MIIIGISYIILQPVFSMLSTAFMDPVDIYDITVRWVPKHFTLTNFKPVMTVMEYGTTFTASLGLSLIVAAVQVASCSFIGYGLARFRFKGKNLIFALVLLTLVIPPQTIMIPLFLHYRFFDVLGIISLITGKEGGVNLLDSFWPFIMQAATGMGIKNGLYIFIFRQFFAGIPRSFEEAAYVDGASAILTFRKVILPNAVPAMIIVFLFSFVWQWNDEFYSGIFLQGARLLPMALQTMASTIETMAGIEVKMDPYYISLLNNTGALLVVGPPLLLYIFLQRYFVESIARAGIVG